MGYYTFFRIKFTNFDVLSPEQDFHKRTSSAIWAQALEELLSDTSNYTFDLWEANDNVIMFITDQIKWYDFKEDMEKVSAAYPKLKISVRGSGEESGDEWKCFFTGGKLVEEHEPTVTWPTVPEGFLDYD